MNAQLHPTRGYVGGGSIAALLGLSPFSTPLDQYLLIVNEMQDVMTPEKQEFFDDRRDLEPWAAKKFTRKTGLAITRYNERYQDAEFDWMRAEIDFEAEDGSTGETKSVHPNAAWQWGDPDTEEPPYYVTAQAMHGLGVTGKEKCYVQALIGFDDYRLYEVHRDDELIARIRKSAHDFWRYHVMPRRAPEPTCAEDLLRLYKRDSGRSVAADAIVRRAVDEIESIKQRIKLLEANKISAEFLVKDFMRDATELTVGGKAVATWRTDSRGIRIFRLK